ncbi:hypothetical protein CC79DRAFT_745691 [Sarocladium strictum]
MAGHGNKTRGATTPVAKLATCCAACQWSASGQWPQRPSSLVVVRACPGPLPVRSSQHPPSRPVRCSSSAVWCPLTHHAPNHSPTLGTRFLSRPPSLVVLLCTHTPLFTPSVFLHLHPHLSFPPSSLSSSTTILELSYHNPPITCHEPAPRSLTTLPFEPPCEFPDTTISTSAPCTVLFANLSLHFSARLALASQTDRRVFSLRRHPPSKTSHCKATRLFLVFSSRSYRLKTFPELSERS